MAAAVLEGVAVGLGAYLAARKLGKQSKSRGQAIGVAAGAAVALLGGVSAVGRKLGLAGLGDEYDDPWSEEGFKPVDYKDDQGRVIARYSDPANLLKSAFVERKIELPGMYADPNLSPWGIKQFNASDFWRALEQSLPWNQGTTAYGGYGSSPFQPAQAAPYGAFYGLSGRRRRRG